MIIEPSKSIPDGVLFQLPVESDEVTVSSLQLVAQLFGLLLLPLHLSNVGDRFHNMGAAIRRWCICPLHKEIFVVWQRDLTGGYLSRPDGFRHLAEGAWSRAGRNLFVAGLVGDVAEFPERHLVLKDRFIGDGVDDRHNDRRRFYKTLWLI